jgi:F-type H+-transporting ATPase subunit c
MSDMTWFTSLSTVGAALAIAIGVLGPAIAMGLAIRQALDSLARQPAIYVLVIVLIVLFRNPLLEYMLPK